MGCFARYMKRMRQSGVLVVQPRMGFGTVVEMRNGLLAVNLASAPTIGTITLDSYTRVNNYMAAKNALESGQDLNGFPIVTHGASVTRNMLSGIQGDSFPIQVRHGTALPQDIFKVIIDSGIDSTEGGPVSYCLPYSRINLSKSIDAWSECCEIFAQKRQDKTINHLESFAGCMLGQLAHPSLLIALSILEGLFFKKYGLVDISLSFAQGTNSRQDIAALSALRKLAEEYLDGIECHIVMYTYMGVFPKTTLGASKLIEESARVAKIGGAHRLIVKTPAEAYRIPTVVENVEALELATQNSLKTQDFLNDENYKLSVADMDEIYDQAKILVEETLNLSSNINNALLLAFESGYLDVPFCLHKNNANKARCYIDSEGYLRWANVGKMPLNTGLSFGSNWTKNIGAYELLNMLSYNQRRFDNMNQET